MITKSTAVKIWKCYDEIEKGRNLFAQMEEAIKEGKDPNPRDGFGRHRNLQLGVPMGEGCHRLFDVHTRLALSVIRAHIAEKEKELVESNEIARLEL